MNSELIMKSDVLDIIFENRNKQYGAYTIRKFYNFRLLKSICIMLAGTFILCAFTFLPDKKTTVITYQDVEMANIKVNKTSILKKVVPKLAKSAAVVAQTHFVTPIIIDSNLVIVALQTLKTTDVIGLTNIVTNQKGVGGIINAPNEGTGGTDSVTNLLPAKVDKTIPVDNPDVEPAYPGGINALRKFLERNLINPTEMEQGEMVAVNIRFIVGYDGKLQKFTIVKDGGELYNSEVIRVMKKMPQWIPGKAKGENVAVYFTIPVKFVPAD